MPGAEEGKHDIHYQNKENKSIAVTVCAVSQLFPSILSEIKRLPLEYYIPIASSGTTYYCNGISILSDLRDISSFILNPEFESALGCQACEIRYNKLSRQLKGSWRRCC